jgi:hypothetical protein
MTQYACEMQEAGIAVRMASSLGISVDHRRRNKSLESLQVPCGMCGISGQPRQSLGVELTASWAGVRRRTSSA